MGKDTLERLAATIRERRTEEAGRSYTRQLLDGGPERCARKLGEEALETVIAGISQDERALVSEAADLSIIACSARSPGNLGKRPSEPERRMGTSLAEKAARASAGNPS